MSKILTSSKFVKSVRRRCMAPENTEVYDDQDILDIASEEIDTEIMPSLLSINENYMLYSVNIPVETGVDRYRIPERAVGSKLKDVALVDSSNNVFELAEISVGRLSDYTTSYTTGYETGIFYIENNEIVFVSSENEGYESVRMYFYMSPSVLVEEDQAGLITSVVRDTTQTTITISNFPDKFSNISLNNFDTVSGKNPNRIYNYDITAIAVNKNTKTVTFNTLDIDEELQRGDYLCFAGETVVPQVPVEFHPILAQSVAVHILEGLGDEQGKQSAERKLERMTKKVLGMFEKRVEESGRKIVSRHSTMSEASFRGTNRRSGRRY